MRAFRLTRRFAFLLGLLLLCGQQAALAHLASHLGGTTTATVALVDTGDEEHGAALALSHACTTCAAIDAYAAPLPALPRLDIAARTACHLPAAAAPFPALAVAQPYAARAPPAPPAKFA